MFSRSPGQERAKGWRSVLSWPPLGLKHMVLCSAASSGTAAPSPGDMARPHGSNVVRGQAITSTSGQSKHPSTSAALPTGTRKGPFCPFCSTQQLCFIARGFFCPTWLVEQRFPPGALELVQRAQTLNEKLWLQPGTGTSQAGMKESAICLEHP